MAWHQSGSLRSRIAQELEIKFIFWDRNLLVEFKSLTLRRRARRFRLCSVEHITNYAIFCDGYEREDYRSAQPSCDSFPTGPHAGRNAFSHRFSFLRSICWGRFAQRSDHRINQPTPKYGSASLVHAFIRGAYRDKYFVALIDGRDSFDPCALANSILHQLLWVRCIKALEAVKAADLLLRDGNFPLVIVDLILNSAEELRTIPQTTWYRLQRLVESVPTACLVLTRYEMVSSAQLKLVLENSWNLETLEKDDAISQLRIVVKRSHLKSVVPPSVAAATYGAASNG